MIPTRNLSTFTRILYNSAKNGPNGPVSANKSKSEGPILKNKKEVSPPAAAPPPPPRPAAAAAKTAKPIPEEVFRNDQYNCKEYFNHNRFSFFDLIEQMSEKRLPQRSNKMKY